MNKFKFVYVQMMDIKSLLVLVLSVSITLAIYGSKYDFIQAQETKGGGLSTSERVFSSSSSSGIKGGLGFSSFRQNIASVQQQNQLRQQIQQQQNFQRQEEQVIQQPIQPSTVQISNIVSSSSVFQRPTLLNQQQITTSTNSKFVEEQRENIIQQQQQTDSEPAVYGSVSGVPGIDFPGYTTIPNTPFSCEFRPFDPGMYADESTGCQVYHLCYQGRRESFLCGIGTVFNQAIMNCDFWHAVDCSKSSEYYYLNSEFGKASAEGGGSQVINNFAKQEVSSGFLSNQNQIQVQPTPILNGKTNFVNQQQFSTNQLIVPPRPKLTSSTSFSRIETSSKSIEPQIYNGKTSIRKEEQIFRNSQNSLSPSRQIQFNQRNQTYLNFIEPNQQSLESSNQFKVVNGNKQTFSSSGNGKTSTALFDFKQKTAGTTFGIKGGLNEISQPEQNDDGAWKPYFKSKSTAKNQISSQTTSSFRPTVDMSTNEVSSTISLPDHEPSFSGPSSNGDGVVLTNGQPKVPKGSAPYETTTTATATKEVVGSSSDTNSNTSIEPDVSPALTSTSPTPEVSTNTDQSSPTSLGPASSSSSDENVSIETTTTPKTSSQEETTTATSTPTGENGEENDFGSRSSRSSGQGVQSSTNSSGLVLTHSSVEYETNESAEKNKTTRS